MRDGLAAFAADNSARELSLCDARRDPRRVLHVARVGNARYVANGASDSVLDELVAEARKDAIAQGRARARAPAGRSPAPA